MEFTSREKKAIVAVLTSIMKADGVIAANEQDFLNKVYRKIGIHITELQEIANMDLSECKQIVDTMSEEKKTAVSKCFLDMVGVDGRVDLRELRVLHNLI